MTWLFPEHVGERTICRSPDSSGGAGVAQLSHWLLGDQLQNPRSRRGSAPWSVAAGGGGHPIPPALSAWWKLPDIRQFFVVAPLLWSPGPCRAVVCCGLLLLGPRLGPARRSWPLGWVAWWGLGVGVGGATPWGCGRPESLCQFSQSAARNVQSRL